MAAVNKILSNVCKKAFLPLAIGLSAITLSSQSQYNKPQKKNNDDSFEQFFNTKKDVYSYYDKDGNLKVFNPTIGQSRNSVKTDNEKLNKIIDYICDNGKYLTDRDWIMLDQSMELADSYYPKTAGNKILENNEMTKLIKKISKKKLSKEEISQIQTPTIYDINNWSEGLDRKISYIKMIKSYDGPLAKLRDELENIGHEMGFKVIEVDINHIWLEDYSIRRHDGKVYHPINPGGIFVQELPDEPVITYQNTTADYDKVMGKSYLEGGNVLNTINANGEPAAIIGKESVYETLTAMNLEKNKTNIANAKLKIAEELGLNPKNITYIPQVDFHIDMLYRPLQNGVIAIPDFDKGINILKEIDLPDTINNNKKEYITRLEDVRNETKSKLEKAEDILEKAGYKTVKIPVFSHTSDYGPSSINFMNGICGTSPNGEKFYITNKSEIDELNKIAEKYFKEAGIDKVYFVSTLQFLLMYGGIDCLTQEM